MKNKTRKNELNCPKYIYKYKPLRSEEDLQRLIDIIDFNRIYTPHYYELNDPLEGQDVEIEITRYAGISIYYNADKEDMIIQETKKKYGILCFSDIANSSQLWTHYASGYSGVCLCFSSEGAFSDIRPVRYVKKQKKMSIREEEVDSYLYKLVKESFYLKMQNWSYEREFRLVVERGNEGYYYFDPTALKGIILGHKVPEKKIEAVFSHLSPDIKRFKTDIGYRTCQINILNYDYKYEYDGSELRRVDLEKELSSS